jgi:hypothetical protein
MGPSFTGGPEGYVEVSATSIPAYFCLHSTPNNNIKAIPNTRSEALTAEPSGMRHCIIQQAFPDDSIH